MRNTTYYGRHGRPHSPLLVHPPFPSFTWVMTAQTSSPTNAYAHGYVQNAHARAQAQTQTQTYPQNHLPASCAAHHGCYQHRPCFAKPLLSPEPAPALESAEASPAALHGTFMETVDYRYYDPPTRPYVPWRAGFAPYEMQQLPPLAASSSRMKRRRLDSLLRALRRACGLSKGIRPSHAAA